MTCMKYIQVGWKNNFFLLAFNNITSLVTQCFMIFVQGSDALHIEMGRKWKLAKKLKIVNFFLEYFQSIIYFASKAPNLESSSY